LTPGLFKPAVGALGRNAHLDQAQRSAQFVDLAIERLRQDDARLFAGENGCNRVELQIRLRSVDALIRRRVVGE
jgi:hypothetical protein